MDERGFAVAGLDAGLSLIIRVSLAWIDREIHEGHWLSDHLVDAVDIADCSKEDISIVVLALGVSQSTPSPGPFGGSFVDLFEERVQRTPGGMYVNGVSMAAIRWVLRGSLGKYTYVVPDGILLSVLEGHIIPEKDEFRDQLETQRMNSGF